MTNILIEVAVIGFNNFIPVEKAIGFLNKYQNIFSFELLRDVRFESHQPNNGYSYQTSEIYQLMNELLSDIKGLHHLIIGIVEKRLDGKKWGNLFGSMQTNDNDTLTGKAITTTYQVNELLKPIPIEIYYAFEFISFAIRFVVGKGLIHDDERGCIFHRKINKTDISEAIKAGYISLDSQNKINNYLEINQIIQFKTVISLIGDIARSETPEDVFNNYLKVSKAEINDTGKESIKINIFIDSSKTRRMSHTTKISKDTLL